MNIHIPRGTADILPGEVEKWQYVEQAMRTTCQRYNYREIRTPIFEHTELFQRGVGETTDIVEKEMYTFMDKGSRSITLRPEGTASVVRSYVDNKMHGEAQQPKKLFYTGPMFRYERPQAGRMRQLHQFGVEAIGSHDPAIDAEVIAMALHMYHAFGVKGLRLELNSVGCPTCRPKHREALVAHLHDVQDQLPADDRSRLDRNPLRILDSKEAVTQRLTQDAPSILDFLCDDCRPHFDAVQAHLTEMGIDFVINPRLVRGLDYYTQTAFEIMAEGIGAIETIGAGGRYNGLVREIGGPDVPGIGFALGLERLMLILEKQTIHLPVETGVDCYLITMGEAAEKKGPAILYELRNAGISADTDYTGRGMKGKMKAANRLQATYVAIVGEDEVNEETIVLKHMESGEQHTVPLTEAAEHLKQKLPLNE